MHLHKSHLPSLVCHMMLLSCSSQEVNLVACSIQSFFVPLNASCRLPIRILMHSTAQHSTANKKNTMWHANTTKKACNPYLLRECSPTFHSGCCSRPRWPPRSDASWPWQSVEPSAPTSTRDEPSASGCSGGETTTFPVWADHGRACGLSPMGAWAP